MNTELGVGQVLGLEIVEGLGSVASLVTTNRGHERLSQLTLSFLLNIAHFGEISEVIPGIVY